jgi:hypothetical protein
MSRKVYDSYDEWEEDDYEYYIFEEAEKYDSLEYGSLKSTSGAKTQSKQKTARNIENSLSKNFKELGGIHKTAISTINNSSPFQPCFPTMSNSDSL